MNRFKLKRKKDGEIIFDDCISNINLEEETFVYCFNENGDETEDDLINYEWLEYIGLNDKNNKMIYKGDKIKDYDGEIYKVIFEDGSYTLDGFSDSSMDYPTVAFSEGTERFEVI